LVVVFGLMEQDLFKESLANDYIFKTEICLMIHGKCFSQRYV